MLAEREVKTAGTDPALGPKLRRKLGRYAKVLSGEFLNQVRLVQRALFDPATPFRAKAILGAALAYFLLPTDALPDFMPAFGFTDDAAVLGMALRELGQIVNTHRRRVKETGPPEDRRRDPVELRLALAEARREIRRLRRENGKWKRTAKTAVILTAALSGLLLWLLLSPKPAF